MSKILSDRLETCHRVLASFAFFADDSSWLPPLKQGTRELPREFLFHYFFNFVTLVTYPSRCRPRKRRGPWPWCRRRSRRLRSRRRCGSRRSGSCRRRSGCRCCSCSRRGRRRCSARSKVQYFVVINLDARWVVTAGSQDAAIVKRSTV